MSGNAVPRCHACGAIQHATSRIAHETLSQNIIKKGINASACVCCMHFDDVDTGILDMVKKESPTRPQRKSGCAARDTFARLRDRFARKVRGLRRRRSMFASCIESRRQSSRDDLARRRRHVVGSKCRKRKPARSSRNAPVDVHDGSIEDVSLLRPRAARRSRRAPAAR